jgi:hypothetical protein
MGEMDLFCGNNPRLIEEKIIEYIVNIRQMEKDILLYTIMQPHSWPLSND